jgi:hypothetical protein
MFSAAHSLRRRPQRGPAPAAAAAAAAHEAETIEDAAAAAGAAEEVYEAAAKAEVAAGDTSSSNGPSSGSHDRVPPAWLLGRPARFVSESSPDFASCGWLWSPEVQFERQALTRLCNALLPAVARMKGVLRWAGWAAERSGARGALGGRDKERCRSGQLTRLIGSLLACRVSKKEWVSLHVDEEMSGNDSGCNTAGRTARVRLEPTAYRLDSRLEVIVPRCSLEGVTKASSSASAAAGVAARDSMGDGRPAADDVVRRWEETLALALSAHDWELAEDLIMHCLLSPEQRAS